MKRSALPLLVVFAGAASGYAQVTYATSFEAPSWTSSQSNPFLSNGWNGYGSSTTAAQFNLNTNSAFAFDGTQSIRFTQQTANFTNYSVISPNFGTTSNQFLTASTKLYLSGDNSGTTSSGTTTGRQIGLQLFGSSATTSLLLERASNANGDLKVIFRKRDSFTDNTSSVTVPNGLNTWIDLSLTLDFVSKTAFGTVNGTPITINTPGDFGSPSFAGVNQVWFFTRGASSSRGLAYYDQFSATNVPVPEPASIAALGLGAFGLLKRRRK